MAGGERERKKKVSAASCRKICLEEGCCLGEGGAGWRFGHLDVINKSVNGVSGLMPVAAWLGGGTTTSPSLDCVGFNRFLLAETYLPYPVPISRCAGRIKNKNSMKLTSNLI